MRCGSRLARAAVVLLVGGYGLALAPDAASAVSDTVVLSQIYGGGGNTGAPYQNDYIELFNRGDSLVSLDGWSVQYASATGTGSFGATSAQITPLSGTLAPGQYLLIQEAAGAGPAAPLPPADIIDSTPIAMSATGGKVALTDTTTMLGCNGGSTPCPPDALARIVDLVGYGGADFFEGAGAAPTLSNTTAAFRNDAGCQDTDDNSADFTVGGPAPRNSATPVHLCLGDSGLTIHDIQGASHLSPLDGQAVSKVAGVVTATRSNGFYMQDPSPDSDEATSEGIFVFTFSAPAVRVGDLVQVSGAVEEFRPGGSLSTSLTTTELVSPTVTVVSSRNPLPAPTVVGTGGRVPPPQVIEDDASGDVETSGRFDPAADGIDFYESLEGMRLRLNDAVAVGPRNAFGEIPVVGDDGANASVRTARGGLVIGPTDFNPERVMLDDTLLPTPVVDVGDHFTSAVVGVLDYSFNNFKLNLTTPAGAVDGGLAKEATTPAGSKQIAIATLNVENLDPTDGAAKFNALGGLIVNNLRAPDVIALQEVQDNDGPANTAVTDANVTLDMLVAAVQTAGGPEYEWRQINPVDDQDGGEPGGNIRVAFMFRTDRDVEFIDRPGGDATTATQVIRTPAGPQLRFSPGRVDPANPAFDASRKPLAAEFKLRGRKFFMVANHFNSKGSDQPLFGHFQPPQRFSEAQRGQQAQVLRDFAGQILAIDPNANVVVLGDFNDFEFSAALQTLEDGVLSNMTETLPNDQRYSYIFEGNSQTLDHILVSDRLRNSTAFAFDIVHVNAEFAERTSDHDPPVVRFTLSGTPRPPAGASR
jgi:predicted extracellular nuclease